MMIIKASFGNRLSLAKAGNHTYLMSNQNLQNASSRWQPRFDDTAKTTEIKRQDVSRAKSPRYK